MQNKDDLAYHLTTHLRLNAIYWGLTAVYIMDNKDALDKDDLIEFVMSCWDDEAGALARFAPAKEVDLNWVSLL
jgi:geranylgeranyl transferase type-2 subunit beta